MTQEMIIDGVKYLPEIDRTLQNFDKHILEEAEYTRVVETLGISTVSPENRIPTFFDLMLDTEKNLCTVRDIEIPLSETETKILWAFIRVFPAPMMGEKLTAFLKLVSGKDDLQKTSYKKERLDKKESNSPEVIMGNLSRRISAATNNEYSIKSGGHNWGHLLSRNTSN